MLQGFDEAPDRLDSGQQESASIAIKVVPWGQERLSMSNEFDYIVLDPALPEHKVMIGSGTDLQIREHLIEFLRKKSDQFAWSHFDITGIIPEVITHKLNINPDIKPVQQKRRKFALERNTIINEEIQKLLDMNMIREVMYPSWLANVVVVQKKNGKWRVCVDYTDLDKACP